MTEEQKLKLNLEQYKKRLKHLLDLRNIDLNDEQDLLAQQVKIIIEIMLTISERVGSEQLFTSSIKSIRSTI